MHPNSFFALPQEIREMIYGYVVGGHRERGNVCYATPWSLRLLPDTPSFTGLLCTNKQMCQEAGIILYEQNTFVTIFHAEDPVLFQRQNTAAHPFSRVRDLVIQKELREQDWDIPESRLRSYSFAALARMPKVRCVRLLTTVGIRVIPFLSFLRGGATSLELNTFPRYQQMMFNFFCSLPTSAAEITFDMEALFCHLRLTTPLESHQALYFQESSTPIAHLCKGNQKLYEAYRAMSKPDAEVYNLKGEQLLHYCQFWDIPTNDPRIPRAIREA
jgi:hypothetical protein